MTPGQAAAFVEQHGIVLVSAKGPVPRLAEAVAGEPIRGSWWGHPKSHDIFRVLQSLEDSPDILACRLIGGKVTLVHRRLWPALIRAAGHFPLENLARAIQQHTKAGHHIRQDVPFPDWADQESMCKAAALTEEAALDALGSYTNRRGS